MLIEALKTWCIKCLRASLVVLAHTPVQACLILLYPHLTSVRLQGHHLVHSALFEAFLLSLLQRLPRILKRVRHLERIDANRTEEIPALDSGAGGGPRSAAFARYSTSSAIGYDQMTQPVGHFFFQVIRDVDECKRRESL